MPTPEFVSQLRQFIGHRPLWLSVAIGVVPDSRGNVLLHRRSDTGRWALPGGIIDPGEQPADAVVREVFEETSVLVEPQVLTSVTVSGQVTYPNGDQVQYLELTFRCKQVGGTAAVNDSESLEVGWQPVRGAPVAGAPDLSQRDRQLIEAALGYDAAAAFRFSGIEAVLGSAK
jgi:8-oxo-dGTP pyrophosphatase MutT (NUDIX family)